MNQDTTKANQPYTIRHNPYRWFFKWEVGRWEYMSAGEFEQDYWKFVVRGKSRTYDGLKLKLDFLQSTEKFI